MPALFRRRKLYFNVNTTTHTSIGNMRRVIFPCTQYTASYTGDAYGAVLQDYQPCTTTLANQGAQSSLRRRLATSMYFLPIAESAFWASSTISNKGGPGVYYSMWFGDPTTGDQLTVTGGIAGTTPIFHQHFAAVLNIGTLVNSSSFTVQGQLVVERRHSIEV